MKVKTRFGEIDIKDEKIIKFINGIMGFEDHKKYILLDHPGTDVIKWLQSIEDPNITLPVVNPGYFFQDYSPKINEEDLLKLKIDSCEKAVILCIITVPKQTKKATINLKSPIVINSACQLADQLIAENDDYQIRQPLNPTIGGAKLANSN